MLALGAGLAQAADEFLYTVRAGDHPWNIAQRYCKDPSYGLRLAKLNRIPNDRRMQPGTQLRIPAEWLKLQSSRVRVLAVRGDTRLQTGAGAGRAAVEGESLLPGSSLLTGPQSSATLELEDGSRVLVRQNSELRLVQSQQPVLHNSRLVELELLHGGLENTVTPASGPASRFEIRSPSATTAVRGTQFRVSATDKLTWTEVLEGAVLVSNAAGASTARSGSGTLTEVGLPPGAPTQLLSAPDLFSLPERMERVPMDWPIPPVAGAVRYRTQLAPDARFEVIVSDEVSPGPRARAFDIADDNYVLRVRGIDANGLEEISATRALVVHARPEPPLLIEPAPDSVTVSARPTFRWTQRGTRLHYRLQIASDGNDPAMAPSEQTVASTGNAEPPVDLPSGLYRWRMAAVDPATGRQGPVGRQPAVQARLARARCGCHPAGTRQHHTALVDAAAHPVVPAAART